MSALVRNGTTRHGHMVDTYELLARRHLGKVPEVYQLTSYQASLILDYTDASYTKVRLLDGTVMRTLDFISQTPKVKHRTKVPTPSNKELYGPLVRDSISIESLCGRRLDYNGLLLKYVTFSRYTYCTGGRITVKNPINPNEYLVDCYMFCDSVSSWNYAIRTIGLLIKMAVAYMCKDEYKPLVIDHLLPKFRRRELTDRDLTFIDVPEKVTLPNYVIETIEQMRKLKFMEDDGTSLGMDMKLLLLVGKLIHQTIHFNMEVKGALYEQIQRKFNKKPTLKNTIKQFLVVSPNKIAYNTVGWALTKYVDDCLALTDSEIRCILAYNLYQHQLDLNTEASKIVTSIRGDDLAKLRHDGVGLQILGVVKLCKYQLHK